MEKVINSYESLFVVSLANGEAAVKETVDKFTTLISNNAEIVEVAEWGKRRLAYEIEDMTEGYYVVVTFKTASDFPAELDRLFNIDESIIRSMIVKLDMEALAKNAAAKAKAEARAAARAAAEAEKAAEANAEVVAEAEEKDAE